MQKLYSRVPVLLLAASAMSASLVLPACDAARERLGTSHQALVTPNLTSQRGLVCFTEVDDMATDVLPVANSYAWWDVRTPRSRAVLGGSYVAGTTTLGNTHLQFVVTGFSDSIAFGDKQQVCADVAAQSGCNLVSACWRADGSWAIERASQTSCPPDAPGPTILLQSGDSNRLPPLQADGSTYKIFVALGDGGSSALFLKNDQLVSLQSFSVGPLPSAGFSGFHADRTTMRLALMTDAYNDGFVWGTSVAQQGRFAPGGPTLACSYLPPAPGLFRSSVVGTQVKDQALYLSFVVDRPDSSIPFAPPRSQPLTVREYLDGHLLITTVLPDFDTFGAGFNHFYALRSTTYRLQAAYETADGLSDVAAISLKTMPPPVPAIVDGLKMGVVTFRYADAPPDPYSPIALNEKIFGTSAPYTFRRYIQDVSRGQADLIGATSRNWIVLQDLTTGAPLTMAADCQRPPGSSGDSCRYGAPSGEVPNLEHFKTQARRGGFNPDGYERLVFYVHGPELGNTSTLVFDSGLPTLESDGLPDLKILIHEVGHTLTFGHSYQQICPREDLWNLASSPTNNVQGCDNHLTLGSRATTGVPTSYDAQFSAYNHPFRWHSMHQYDLGWIPESEVARLGYFAPDATFTLAPLSTGAAGGRKRQIRVEAATNAIYAIEYRTATGFDGPMPSFDNRDQDGDGLPDRAIYEDPTGVSIWLHGHRSEDNNLTYHAVASRMRAGDSYCDPFRKLEVRVLADSATEATVRVEHHACTPFDAVCPMNGVRDGGETGVDCGGPCPKCPVGQACSANNDCQTSFCWANTCYQQPNCSDGVKTPPESDVDCGGACSTCANGHTCSTGADCQSTFCSGGLCQAVPTCSDGIRNQGEADIDCGGPCVKCAIGRTCGADADCLSTSCSGGVCQALACSVDGIRNQGETDIDCGGMTTCDRCALGKKCKTGSDCQSGLCFFGGTCH